MGHVWVMYGSTMGHRWVIWVIVGHVWVMYGSTMGQSLVNHGSTIGHRSCFIVIAAFIDSHMTDNLQCTVSVLSWYIKIIHSFIHGAN